MTIDTSTREAWIEPTIEILPIAETQRIWGNGLDGSARPDDSLS